jgi:hypothetical protein
LTGYQSTKKHAGILHLDNRMEGNGVLNAFPVARCVPTVWA